MPTGARSSAVGRYAVWGIFACLPAVPARLAICHLGTVQTPVSDPSPTRADAATAGALLIGAIVACAAAGFGLGSLLGLGVPAGLAGLFVGLVAGFALVYARFRRV